MLSILTSATSPTNDSEAQVCKPGGRPAKRIARRLAEYVKNVGWTLILIIIIINVSDYVGQAIGFTGLFGHYPAILLVLTINPVFVVMAAHQVSLVVFLPIATARILAGFYIDYLVGKRLAEVAELQAKEYLTRERIEPKRWQLWKRFVARLEAWLEAKGEGQHFWIMTLCVGRFATALIPWFPGIPIYAIAGAAEVSPRKLAVISVIAAIVEVVIIYQVGTLL
jgi:hypothetical protein